MFSVDPAIMVKDLPWMVQAIAAIWNDPHYRNEWGEALRWATLMARTRGISVLRRPMSAAVFAYAPDSAVNAILRTFEILINAMLVLQWLGYWDSVEQGRVNDMIVAVRQQRQVSDVDRRNLATALATLACTGADMIKRANL